MLGKQLMYGTSIIVLTVIFHVVCLVLLVKLIQRLFGGQHSPSASGSVALLSFAVFGIIAIHTVEAWAWAAIYMAIGEFAEISQALYFSLVTATTLGYGDVTLSPQWQLLGTFESMGGLILFGASTAFLLQLMRRVFLESKEN